MNDLFCFCFKNGQDFLDILYSISLSTMYLQCVCPQCCNYVNGIHYINALERIEDIKITYLYLRESGREV